MSLPVYVTPHLAPRAQVAVVLVLTIVYALCFIAIAAGRPFAPPLGFAGLRASLGGLFLLSLLAARRQPFIPPPASWPWIGAIALTATTLAFGAMFLTSGRTGAGIASVLGNTQPLIVPALAAVFLNERMTTGKWVALVWGLAGVIVIASPQLIDTENSGAAGPALALAASLGLALSTMLVKRMRPQIDVLVLTAWQLLVGSVPLLVASSVVEGNATVRWTRQFVGLLLFLALPGTALANAVWYWLIRRGDVGRLSMFFFLIPAFGLLFASVILGEAIAPLEILGVGLTFAAIGVVAWEGVSTQA